MIPEPNAILAKNYGSVAHHGQTYDDDTPYDFHLEKVAQVCIDFKVTDQEMLSACYLHDVFEDTRKSYKDVASKFGVGVAELVFAVTDERGRNRKEKHERTYPKVQAHPRAVTLKLADRIANVVYGLHNEGKTAMYREEFDFFFGALFRHPKSFPEIAPDVLRIERAMWKYLARQLNLVDSFDEKLKRLDALLGEQP